MGRVRLRFSLRALLLTVTSTSLIAGLVLMPALAQRRAARLLEAGDAIVSYNTRGDGGFWENLLGSTFVDLFYRVERVQFAVEWQGPPLDPTCLASLRGIKSLSLQQDAVSDDLMRAIADLPVLEDLWSCARMSDAGACELTRCRKLRWLTIDASGMTDQGIAELAKIPSVEGINLDIRGRAVSRIGVERLAALRHLRTLTLRRTTCPSIDPLRDMAELWSLVLSESSITDDGLKNAGSLSGLAELDLSDTAISSSGLEHVGTIKSLRKLYLSRTRVTSQGLRHLEHLPALESLSLSETLIDDRGLESIGRLENLKELWLSNTQITDEGLKHLAELKQLVVLGIENTRVTDEGVKCLGRFKRLDAILAAGTQVSPEAAASVERPYESGESHIIITR